jgi:hypothetical protein
MVRLVVNVPMVVECNLKSYTSEDESVFQFDKTDFVTLSDIVVLGSVSLPAGQLVFIDE